MDLRVLSQDKLWEALQREGYTERGFRTVRRWVEKGVAPTPEAERIILKILGIERGAAPSSTRRLLAGVMALEEQAGIDEDVIARMESRVDEMELTARETDERIAAELEASRRKSAGRTTGRADGQAGESRGNTRRKPR